MVEETDAQIKNYTLNEMSGEEFCTLFPNLSKKLVKLTNEPECHNGFQFKTGLNEDHIPFNPNSQCQKGGIYFTDMDNISYWLEYHGIVMVYCRTVTLPQDCRVYIEENKFKADKIILGDKVKIKHLSCWSDNDFCLNTVRKSVSSLKYIRDINRDILLEVFKMKHSYGISLILERGIDLPEELQIEAVKIDSILFSLLLRNKVEVSKEVQLEAIKRSYRSIEYLLINGIELSEEIKLAAVRKDWWSAFSYFLEYGIELSEKLKLQAAMRDYNVITYLTDNKIEVSKEVYSQAIKTYYLH